MLPVRRGEEARLPSHPHSRLVPHAFAFLVFRANSRDEYTPGPNAGGPGQSAWIGFIVSSSNRVPAGSILVQTSQRGPFSSNWKRLTHSADGSTGVANSRP